MFVWFGDSAILALVGDCGLSSRELKWFFESA
jgi:hypothetical protein